MTKTQAPTERPPEGEIAKVFDEQIELVAARLPVLEAGRVHPSPIDHDELKAPHPDAEDLLLGNAEPSAETLAELAALQAAPELSDEELARQALEDGDPATPE